MNPQFIKAKEASRLLALATDEVRSNALKSLAKMIVEHQDAIIAANLQDLKQAKEQGMKSSFIDRLQLDAIRIRKMAEDAQMVADLSCPTGRLLSEVTRPNGLVIQKVSVPLGVIGVIYEARPNVTVDIAALCLKTGNAVLLRGGKEAQQTNQVLVDLMQKAIQSILPKDSIQLIIDPERIILEEMLKSKEMIDCIIPRGGKTLIDYVVANSQVPIIETGAGNCHLYIDEEADLQMAIDIAINAKVSRPSVCNAIEKILVHGQIASKIMPSLVNALESHHVTIKGCPKTLKLVHCLPISEEDYTAEYNDLIVSIFVVESIDQAISHINTYSTHHSDAIITTNDTNASRFLTEVDSACVYHNASTRFSDGGEFGFGAEVGISTQKLHARGPMGLEALTSYQYRVHGKGQIR